MRHNIILVALLFFFILSYQAFAEEITLTTYYPAPYGSYNELQLYPHSPPTVPCDASHVGVMFYDSSEDTLKICNSGNAWNSPGFWVLENAIPPAAGEVLHPKDLAWNVGIGTGNPQNKLEVAGGATVGSGYAGTASAPADGLIVEGAVGIGISGPAPLYKLQVIGDSTSIAAHGSLIGIEAIGDDYGVSAHSSFNTGLYGWGLSYGVHGFSDDVGVSGEGGFYGVTGYGSTTGVYGSGSDFGVYGDSIGLGVYGLGGPWGILGQGSDFGVVGWATDPSSGNGVGGYGHIGVQGSGSTYGVYGDGGIGGYFRSGAGYALQTGDGDVDIQNNITIGGEAHVVSNLIVDANVGIGTASPLGALDVNGAIYQRGLPLHPDYVFDPAFPLESIDEHSAYMWQNKHLKSVPSAAKDKEGKYIVEVGAQSRGLLEELEKAHIYIEQLHKRIRANEQLEVRIRVLEEKLETLQK